MDEFTDHLFTLAHIMLALAMFCAFLCAVIVCHQKYSFAPMI